MELDGSVHARTAEALEQCPPVVCCLEKLEGSTRFQLSWLEKALRLQEVLVRLQEDRRLYGRLALKGGTALNFCYLGLARLSIDLDFNYVGTSAREAMQDERPGIEERIERLAAIIGYGVRRLGSSYAETTWSLSYTTVRGGPDSLRVQLNYLHRVPLFGTRQISDRGNRGRTDNRRVLREPGGTSWAGRSRRSLSVLPPRDLYDVYRYTLNPIDGLDPSSLRIAFTVLAATMARDVRTATAETVCGAVREREIRVQLLPLLRRGENADRAAMITSVSPLLGNLCNGRLRSEPS